MIARILFSAWWNLLWWIKTKLVWRWQMHWLQEYYFMYVGTLCDASKQIFFLSIVCSDCKNTVFCMMEPSLMNQNEISLEVTNALIARILFYVCWDIVWCIKTHFLFKYCMYLPNDLKEVTILMERWLRRSLTTILKRILK